MLAGEPGDLAGDGGDEGAPGGRSWKSENWWSLSISRSRNPTISGSNNRTSGIVAASSRAVAIFPAPNAPLSQMITRNPVSPEI